MKKQTGEYLKKKVKQHIRRFYFEFAFNFEALKCVLVVVSLDGCVWIRSETQINRLNIFSMRIIL